MTQPTDDNTGKDRTAELVGYLRRGDRDAGALLSLLYREPVQRFCWGYLGRTDEAEDVWQEVCYRVITTKKIPDSFRAWLYKIARNQCLNALRARANRRDGVQLVPTIRSAITASALTLGTSFRNFSICKPTRSMVSRSVALTLTPIGARIPVCNIIMRAAMG